MILVRNCPHNNGICTLIDENQEMVLKSSYSDDGRIRLRREYAGYEWYFKQKKILNDSVLSLIENNKKSYSRLHIKLFHGYEGEYYKNISYNRVHLLMAINMYKEVWPENKGKLSPLHGDFSLGNLIFNGQLLTIIDWEHFQFDGAPWGFDLVNLLYESVFFSFNGKSTLNSNDSHVFREIRKVILDLFRHQEDFNCKIDDLTGFISKNVHIWGELVNKLPVMKFSKAQCEFLQTLEQ